MERWPLVGRTAVAARLRTLVAAGRGAVVTGPAGVGKTALVGAVAREVEPDAAVVVVRATETAGSLPFGAFAPLLPAGDAWPRGTITEAFVLRQVARSLAEASAGRPLAVVVDDAQFLDDPSAALVHYLATSGEAAVVATTRAGQHVPDAISDLWVAGILDRIELASLTEAEIEEVLVAALGGPVAPATIRQFARRSAGNPLFLRELLQGALDADAIGLDDGEWQLRGALRPSPRLTELIRLRLDHLDASEQDLLQLVAVHEPLGAGTLAALSRRETADSLAGKGVVTVRVEGRRAAVWLSHPLYGEVARAMVSPLRARELLQQRAAFLESVGRRRREDALVVATWRLTAGGGDAEVLLAGAKVALAHNDPALAAQLADAAIEAGGGFDEYFVAAEAAYARGDAATVSERVAVLVELAATDVERTRVAAFECDVAAYLRGVPDVAALDRAAAQVTDPACLEELAQRRLTILRLTKGVAATVAAADAILADADPGAGRYSFTAPVVFASAGRIADSIALLEQPRRLPGMAVDDWEEALRTRYLGRALMLAGRLGEAEALLVPAHERAVDVANAGAQGLLAGGLAALRLVQGALRTARHHAEEAFALFTDLNRRVLVRDVSIVLAIAAAQAGDADAASLAFSRLDDIPYESVDDSESARAQAWVTWALGDRRRAASLLEHSATVAAETGNLMSAAASWHDLARLGEARRAEAGLATVAASVEGDLVPAALVHVRGIAHRDAALLEEAGSTFERMGAALYAAEAYNEAAVIHRRAGAARVATSFERRSAALAARCEGARTPGLRDTYVRSALAPAELDTARLAAAGRSNRDIADLLHVSVRTVENRLQRVYEKLGINSRAELGDALDDR